MSITRAVILSAGKGSRLLPHTANRPKCLLDCSGQSLLEWQLDALVEGGVTDITIVTGFMSGLVDEVVARRADERARIGTLFNPFYHVAENVGSVWMARGEMEEDFLILNGDTLIGADIVRCLLAGATAPITVTVDTKTSYDDDDMKVERDGDRLVRIGKTLTVCDAESIGFLAFRGEGRAAFVEAVDGIMHRPEGTTSWYLKVIDSLAPTGLVSTLSINGLEWGEVDYPTDLDRARAMTARWAFARQDALSA